MEMYMCVCMCLSLGILFGNTQFLIILRGKPLSTDFHAIGKIYLLQNYAT